MLSRRARWSALDLCGEWRSRVSSINRRGREEKAPASYSPCTSAFSGLRAAECRLLSGLVLCGNGGSERGDPGRRAATQVCVACCKRSRLAVCWRCWHVTATAALRCGRAGKGLDFWLFCS